MPRPNIVLWPENSLDGDPGRDPQLGFLVAESVQELDSPLLIGALLETSGDRAYNAGQLWLPGQGPVSGYAKRQLVPFGEYIPARSLLGGLGALQLIPRDLLPGTSTDPLSPGRHGSATSSATRSRMTIGFATPYGRAPTSSSSRRTTRRTSVASRPGSPSSS
ncbi:hypothetical protein [Streptomyces labedae]|uniref:hypothetical protein n=1 Tax=Streptomyces labedae TaxID=285569 RepID=UPI0031F819A2